MSETAIALHGVSKRYARRGSATGARAAALSDMTFEAARGRLTALLGHSGCGKTTTLRLIAGLEAPDTGDIWLNGRRVAGAGAWVPPEARRIGMVFQDYALFPHLTARDNVLFALKASRAGPRSQQARAADEALAMVGLAGKGDRYPHQLSGGEQQRLALARALAPGPALLLLDEPFSNLDAALRKEVRGELRRIVTATGVTAVLVTHDQEEALSIADTVAVMRDGRVLQVGAPQDIYLRPVGRDVAEFVGEANFVPGQADGRSVSCMLGRLPLAQPAHGDVVAVIRPESIRLRPDPAADARVDQLVFFGHDQVAQVRLPDGRLLRARALAHTELAPGMACALEVVGPVVAYSALSTRLTSPDHLCTLAP